jgi:hypothetical protein
MDFIENYLFDGGMKPKVPVVVRSGFGFKAMYALWMNVARGEALHIDLSLAALAAKVSLTASNATFPLTIGGITKT